MKPAWSCCSPRRVQEARAGPPGNASRCREILARSAASALTIPRVPDENCGLGVGGVTRRPSERAASAGAVALTAARLDCHPSQPHRAKQKGRFAVLSTFGWRAAIGRDIWRWRVRVRRSIPFVVVFLLFLDPAYGQSWPPLPLAAPASVGFSVERLKAMDAAWQQTVDRQQLAGVVMMMARHGKLVAQKAYGLQSIDRKKEMQQDTIFRIYSMTKPITG